MPRLKKTIEEKESVAERAFMTRLTQFCRYEETMFPVREFLFDKACGNWRFDFAWPAQKVAVEIEGGTWPQKSGHTTGKGYQKDCEKYNRATELGWRILRYTPQMLEYAPDEVISQLENVLRGTFRMAIQRIK